jgi:hypothetical protein
VQNCSLGSATRLLRRFDKVVTKATIREMRGTPLTRQHVPRTNREADGEHFDGNPPEQKAD